MGQWERQLLLQTPATLTPPLRTQRQSKPRFQVNCVTARVKARLTVYIYVCTRHENWDPFPGPIFSLPRWADDFAGSPGGSPPPNRDECHGREGQGEGRSFFSDHRMLQTTMAREPVCTGMRVHTAPREGKTLPIKACAPPPPADDK